MFFQSNSLSRTDLRCEEIPRLSKAALARALPCDGLQRSVECWLCRRCMKAVMKLAIWIAEERGDAYWITDKATKEFKNN